MAHKLLESNALSAFCGSVATMLAAGIQTEEALLMLSDGRESSRFQEVCSSMYTSLVNGSSFAEAMRASGGFPPYAEQMAATGEQSGHLEAVLLNLELYYDEEDRMFEKLRVSLGYPAVLLVVMAAILLFTVLVVLPLFARVYSNMVGSLLGDSLLAIQISSNIGWIAFVVTAVMALVVLYLLLSARTERGRVRVEKLFEKSPAIAPAMYQLALSRFTAALATFVSSGVTHEEAMTGAARTVDHVRLRKRLDAARDSMVNLDHPLSLSQAVDKHGVFEPLYARMLNVGMRSGSADQVLSRLSQTFFEDAIAQIDHSLDHLEPVLAAFLAVAVGSTLIAVMLPLVGIMTALG